MEWDQADCICDNRIKFSLLFKRFEKNFVTRKVMVVALLTHNARNDIRW